MTENRTVTTRSRFDCLERLWRSDKHKSVIAVITSADKNHLYHPQRDPQKHDFTSTCPHKFRLHRQSTTVAGRQKVADYDELVVHLSDSVRTMFDGWNMEWEFYIIRQRGTQVIHRCMTTPNSEPVEWKTITLGKAESIRKSLEEMGVDGKVQFKVVWSREDPALLSRNIEREADKKITQMRTKMFQLLQSPSAEITRLVFHERNGTVKYLYVNSDVLNQYEYFQRCHSRQYSESQTQHLCRPRTAGEEIECEDSDEEWDINEPEDNYEPKKNTAFKATICVAGTSRQTYRAFIEYAICGALYFAPLRFAYHQYRLAAYKNGRQPIPWPEWAEAHCTTYTNVPGCKTLTSPKSLYRLADMLIIPELKDICHRQIIDCLDVTNVLIELDHPLFVHHQELRLAAYKTMRNNWRSFSAPQLVHLFTCLPKDESTIIVNYLLESLKSSSSTHLS